MINPFNDTYFMKQALIEARKAFEEGEVPVGAIVVAGNQIIGKGHNLTEKLLDVTAHAEIQAITAASNFLGAKYLKDWSQIGKVVYGASDERRGANHFSPPLFHPNTILISGVEDEACSNLLKQFFQSKR